jgi:hypothetical protein
VSFRFSAGNSAKINGTKGAGKRRSGRGAGKERLETAPGNAVRRLETTLGNDAWKRRLNGAGRRRFKTTFQDDVSRRRFETTFRDDVSRRRLNDV